MAPKLLLQRAKVLVKADCAAGAEGGGITKRTARTERGDLLSPPLAALAALFVFPLLHTTLKKIPRGVGGGSLKEEAGETGERAPSYHPLTNLFVRIAVGFEHMHLPRHVPRHGRRGQKGSFLPATQSQPKEPQRELGPP